MLKTGVCVFGLFFFLAGVFAAPMPDINEDGIVNLADLSLFAQQWLVACQLPNDCGVENIHCCPSDYFGFANFDLSVKVDAADFAVLSRRWQETGKPSGFLTLEWVAIHKTGFSGQISRYEITNAQYAAFLNALWQQNLIVVEPTFRKVYAVSDTNYTQPYFQLYGTDPQNHTQTSPIDFDGSGFVVRSRDGRDMSNHPVTFVSWYGAKAFCDYYGYRLPTKSEWQAAATYDASYIYGCGNAIDPLRANYNDGAISLEGYGNNPLSLSDFPFTTPVDFYPPAGFGLNDMAGNVAEWTATASAANVYFICGGSYYSAPHQCKIIDTENPNLPASSMDEIVGFRVCK